mgnify:CR=1 FL=1
MNKSYRLTEQKKIVLDEVRSRFDHPTAEEIFNSVHANYPGISKSTVYRNLDVLSQEGLILRIKVTGGDHYDLTTKKHYHVICKKCHKVVDADIKYCESYDKEVEEQTGYSIDQHAMLFEGLCPDCKEEN